MQRVSSYDPPVSIEHAEHSTPLQGGASPLSMFPWPDIQWNNTHTADDRERLVDHLSLHGKTPGFTYAQKSDEPGAGYYTKAYKDHDTVWSLQVSVGLNQAQQLVIRSLELSDGIKQVFANTADYSVQLSREGAQRRMPSGLPMQSIPGSGLAMARIQDPPRQGRGAAAASIRPLSPDSLKVVDSMLAFAAPSGGTIPLSRATQTVNEVRTVAGQQKYTRNNGELRRDCPAVSEEAAPYKEQDIQAALQARSRARSGQGTVGSASTSVTGVAAGSRSAARPHDVRNNVHSYKKSEIRRAPRSVSNGNPAQHGPDAAEKGQGEASISTVSVFAVNNRAGEASSTTGVSAGVLGLPAHRRDLKIGSFLRDLTPQWCKKCLYEIKKAYPRLGRAEELDDWPVEALADLSHALSQLGVPILSMPVRNFVALAVKRNLMNLDGELRSGEDTRWVDAGMEAVRKQKGVRHTDDDLQKMREKALRMLTIWRYRENTLDPNRCPDVAQVRPNEYAQAKHDVGVLRVFINAYLAEQQAAGGNGHQA